VLYITFYVRLQKSQQWSTFNSRSSICFIGQQRAPCYEAIGLHIANPILKGCDEVTRSCCSKSATEYRYYIFETIPSYFSDAFSLSAVSEKLDSMHRARDINCRWSDAVAREWVCLSNCFFL